MDESTKTINENLMRFWDEAIALSEQDKEQIRTESAGDYRELAPSEKLFLAASALGTSSRALDYGCGSGWASIVIAKAGCSCIEAVDLGPRIIDALSFYADAYGVSQQIQPKVIDADWLKSVPADTYDGIICSNVLDVVPLETTKQIIAQFARIAKKDAKIVIGLNFFMSAEAAKARGIELVEGKYLFMQDVLRLLSLSDEEWKDIFAPYFDVVNLDYFAWPGETKESRRLFTLRKK